MGGGASYKTGSKANGIGVTLKQALNLKGEEIEHLKAKIAALAKEKRELNAYIFNESGELDSQNDTESGGESSAKSSPESSTKSSGVPIMIKDNINVKGWEITCASKILKGYIAPYDATAIANLNRNNMCAFGRGNMDEFAMGSTTESSHYGRTKNPVDTSRVPGGSSGGCAAAVAAGIAIAALGSDTGGSIRQPAGYCGVVGLKPTYGRVSRYGLVAYSSSLDQIGPITQNVEDASILFDAISGADPMDSTALNLPAAQSFANLNPNKHYKIAVLKDFLKDAKKDIQNAYDATIKTLEKMGHIIVEKSMLDTNFHISAYYIICTAEASSNLARFDGVRYGRRADAANLAELFIKTRSEGFGDEVKRRIMLGNFVLSSGYYDAFYLKAQKVRALISKQYDEIFSDCDTILLPVAPDVAPKFGATHSPLEMYLSDIYTISVNLAGLPAISLPVAKNADNLPIALQFIGNKCEEQTILNAAYGLEKELGDL